MGFHSFTPSLCCPSFPSQQSQSSHTLLHRHFALLSILLDQKKFLPGSKIPSWLKKIPPGSKNSLLASQELLPKGQDLRLPEPPAPQMSSLGCNSPFLLLHPQFSSNFSSPILYPQFFIPQHSIFNSPPTILHPQFSVPNSLPAILHFNSPSPILHLQIPIPK